MAIQVTCPNCQSTYLLSDALQGKNVRCKKCGEAFRIAAGSPPPARPVVLRPAVTPEEIRGGIQASPARLRNPSTFAEPVRSEEDYIAKTPRHGNSTLKILMIVFGSLAALAVVVCGGIVYLGYQTSKAAKENLRRSGPTSKPMSRWQPKMLNQKSPPTRMLRRRNEPAASKSVLASAYSFRAPTVREA